MMVDIKNDIIYNINMGKAITRVKGNMYARKKGFNTEKFSN